MSLEEMSVVVLLLAFGSAVLQPELLQRLAAVGSEDAVCLRRKQTRQVLQSKGSHPCTRREIL